MAPGARIKAPPAVGASASRLKLGDRLFQVQVEGTAVIRRTARGTAAGPDEWQTGHYKAVAEKFCTLSTMETVSSLSWRGTLPFSQKANYQIGNSTA